jgi:putative peptidoglycan lipid II flippase
MAVHHVNGHFFIPEWGHLVWRVAALCSITVLGTRYGVEGHAVGLGLATLLQWLLLVGAARRRGFTVLPTSLGRIEPQTMRPFWKGAAVVSTGVGLRQVESVADRMAVSFMAAGALAAFSYASRLAYVIPSLVSVAFFMPLAPEIPRVKARLGDPRPLARYACLFLASVGLPLGLVIFRLAPDVVALLLFHGRFDESSIHVVAGAIRAFAVGVPALFTVQGLRGMYVMERNLTEIVRIGILSIAVRAVGNVLLFRYGVTGIALSGTLTLYALATYLWFRSRPPERVAFAWGRVAGSVLAVGLLLFAVPWNTALPHLVPRMLVVAALAAAVHLGLMWPVFGEMKERVKSITTAQ